MSDKFDSNVVIVRFSGAYNFLSNFHPALIKHDGVLFPTSEHAYQAAKTINYQDFLFIAEQPTPGKAKRLGRLLSIREDWESIKITIMKNILVMKFEHFHLRKLLLDTGDAHLEEGNNWGDTFWGVCDGVGENHLGKILMEIRDEIRSIE